ncbi:MAG: 10-formyltetrahydrofolate:L-methionyl-tRNA(fMet) N-formyltransferase [Candidatus Nitrospira kreftii]|uniref:Methionyl-tRNA formyltransferase n=1 Tax=Candidatus Nitrospira kreftii TaxID=2652173 RepID=A0A7S8FH90_9BACT|nr:MAG: 10-formyltetrahydrofolate:L-methionyl-tRNA(fMet) N-formyltransferase [Candidatus Nitrospira kreftii]
MRIVFMGTPAFAVPSLEALLRSDDQVVGVVSQPDRPKGRGQQLVAPPVKLVAEGAGIPVLQPLKIRTPEFLQALSSWQPDLIAVAAYGRILHTPILTLPPKGCVNVHGSLLPKYRGAAPVQWAVINGETETGITTMLMDEGMDTGPMLLQERLEIMPDDTAGTLAPRLAELGGRLLVETIAYLKAGTLTPKRQDDTQATLAPLLKKEDGLINWTMSAASLANRVRGLSPWPGAYTFLGEERWNVWRVVSSKSAGTDKPGTIVAVDKQSILVATGEGLLDLQEIQTANSKRMPVSQFLTGHKVTVGMRLGCRDV